MFDEYCRLFYGPAADEMHAFFAYCEDNWREMETDGEKAVRALELFAAAKETVDEDSVYGRRISLIDNYLNGLRAKRAQLAQKRGPVPRLRLVSGSRGEIIIDGKLDDEAWATRPTASTGRMQELQTGRQPIYGTSIKTAWIRSDLYFALRCQDHPGEKLNIATTEDEDQAMWYGDAVEILLETESHSYYQIVVNPAGTLIDLDRGADRQHWFGWASQAEVATQVADDHWTVEIRIPVTQDENDPLHQVVGRKPTQSLPWHINVCRQRIRENGSEYSAFSPTGTEGFHERMKFAHFYAGLSHEFPADPTVTDYVLARRAAERLMLTGKRQEALDAYVALAAGEKLTDFQKSDALEQAASCARTLRDYDLANELMDQITLDTVAKTVVMENLLAQRKFAELIEQFGHEDFRQWPFWQIGAGAFARGKAYVLTEAGQMAETDLQTALAYTADPRTRINILFTLGSNREMNLHDDDAALEAYRRNYKAKTTIGAANEFRSVQSAARILTRRGSFNEALATIHRANIEELTGYWRHAMLLSLGETLAAAGRTDEALTAYREVLGADNVPSHHREAAENAVRGLENK
jgi:tetratricopeptide (TPR) repeat protein